MAEGVLINETPMPTNQQFFGPGCKGLRYSDVPEVGGQTSDIISGSLYPGAA